MADRGTLLVAVALMLTANAPGDGNTCVTQDIATAAAREGMCQREANLFGGGISYNVVDAGHVLRMPGYDAQLLATTTRIEPVADAANSPTFYPNGTGTLVCREVAITNRGTTSLKYDAGGADVDLLLQSPQSPGTAYDFHDVPDANGEPSPSLAAWRRSSRDRSPSAGSPSSHPNGRLRPSTPERPTSSSCSRPTATLGRPRRHTSVKSGSGKRPTPPALEP